MLLLKKQFRKDYTMNTDLQSLLNYYMTEKHMDDITLDDKCGISPMKIVNTRKGSHTYSREPVKKIGCGLDLSADEMKSLLVSAGF